MRLEKYLVIHGLGSRRVIIEKVKKGEVTVNGKTVFDERIDIYEEDEILHLGQRLKKKEFKYYLLHKTMGYITAMKDDNRPTIVELLPPWFDTDTFFPIGRLDRDTEGVLIFTNDGDTNQKMTQPGSGVEKKYYVELMFDISEESIEKLKTGVSINGHDCLPAKVEKIGEKAIYLTIVEGKFHQVKRMMRAVHNKVIYLKRVSFGKCSLEDLPKGQIKEIFLEDLM